MPSPAFINKMTAQLGKVFVGSQTKGAQVIKSAVGTTTPLGRMYRRGGMTGLAKAVTRGGASAALRGAGIGAGLNVAGTMYANNRDGMPASYGLGGAALRGAAFGGAAGFGMRAGRNIARGRRQMGFGSAGFAQRAGASTARAATAAKAAEASRIASVHAAANRGANHLNSLAKHHRMGRMSAAERAMAERELHGG